FRESEVPAGWGALVESKGTLTLVPTPIRHDATAENRIRLLHIIAVAGRRSLNRQLPLDRYERIVPRHFLRLRQAEQKSETRRAVRQSAVFASELRRVSVNVNEVHRMAWVRSVG